jgi:hypothetical protein
MYIAVILYFLTNDKKKIVNVYYINKFCTYVNVFDLSLVDSENIESMDTEA